LHVFLLTYFYESLEINVTKISIIMFIFEFQSHFFLVLSIISLVVSSDFNKQKVQEDFDFEERLVREIEGFPIDADKNFEEKMIREIGIDYNLKNEDIDSMKLFEQGEYEEEPLSEIDDEDILGN
jgi:hypothetical protein